MGVRMVVAEYVEPEIVDLVVHAQLVFRIHVVVDRSPPCAGDARLAIAKDAAVGAHRVRCIRNAKHALHAAIAPRQDPAHFLRIARASVRHQLLAKCLWKHQADGSVYHQTLSRTISRASSSDLLQTPRLRYFQPPSANRHTMSPCSSVRATRSAACSTAPDEMPANTPS